MWRRLYDRKGQSTGEYALVFAIILGAIIAMQTYVKRGMQGRVKSITDYMARASGKQTALDNEMFDGAGVVTQYDPYDYESEYEIERDTTMAQAYTPSGGGRSVTSPDETTKRRAGEETGYTRHLEAEHQDIDHTPTP